MLDINYIRENLDKVKKSVEARKAEVDLDKLLSLDDERKTVLKEIEEINRKRKIIAERGSKEGEEIVSSDGKTLRYKLYDLEEKLKKIEEKRDRLLLQIPNTPVEDVPEGDASKNKVLRQEGQPTKFNFTPKDHVELGGILDIIDIPRAAKISGSRFGYLKGEGALLEFALIQFAIGTLVKDGFIPIIPPALIKKEITAGLGYWQGGGNENYYLVNDYELEGPEKGKPLPLYLVGTGEHSVVPMHSGEILNENELPRRYVAFSPCFRREAGSYGKDVKGILRVHQFDKVEMVALVKPENDEKERRKLLEQAENLMKSLGLPYQVVKLASGDLGFPTAETMDIETWIPSQNKYRETHSISTTTDFQARRLNIKYRNGDKAEYVHILNGTVFAIGRSIIAILENFQEEDGSVKIPEVLQKYTGFSEIKPK